MRLSAYKTSIDEAYQIQRSIPKLIVHFKDYYNPRDIAISHIVNAARLDTDELSDGEFCELYKYVSDRLNIEILGGKNQ